VIQLPPAPSGSLRLHLNENTAACSPAVQTAIRALERPAMAFYPDYTEITKRIERWFDVGPGRVQITNGLDEGIQMVGQYGAWHYGRPPARRTHGESWTTPEVIVVEPTFEVYEMCAEAIRADLVHIGPEPDFRFPLDRLLDAVTPRTRVIYLTDPNNPTGLGIPPGAVDTIASAAPHALVLVDEAYADFSGRTLVGPLLDRYRNLVIGRTFAKAHGLAALRVGALIAHPSTLDELRRVQLPFTVNICAVTALSAALDDSSYLEWYVAQAAASRDAIYDFCQRHRLTFWSSEANFVLMRVGDRAGAIVRALHEREILVRDKSASPGCAGCIRLTAGVTEHTAAALSALEALLAPRTS
jgi:histidinol-phosphate aminotransferase